MCDPSLGLHGAVHNASKRVRQGVAGGLHAISSTMGLHANPTKRGVLRVYAAFKWRFKGFTFNL